jgi:hypothetical protein
VPQVCGSKALKTSFHGKVAIEKNTIAEIILVVK